MPELSDDMYCSQQITVPPMFPYLLRQYAKAAIRTQPSDLLRWSTAYFRCLSLNVPPPVKPRLEYPISREYDGITPGWLKALLNQLNHLHNIDFKILWDRWLGACLRYETLIKILCLGGFDKPDSIPCLKFIALCCGFISENLTNTMILICEIMTEEPEGGSAMISVEIFNDLYTFLARIDASKPRTFVNLYFTDKLLNFVDDRTLEKAEVEELEEVPAPTEDAQSLDTDANVVTQEESKLEVSSCPDLKDLGSTSESGDFLTDDEGFLIINDENATKKSKKRNKKLAAKALERRRKEAKTKKKMAPIDFQELDAPAINEEETKKPETTDKTPEETPAVPKVAEDKPQDETPVTKSSDKEETENPPETEVKDEDEEIEAPTPAAPETGDENVVVADDNPEIEEGAEEVTQEETSKVEGIVDEGEAIRSYLKTLEEGGESDGKPEEPAEIRVSVEEDIGSFKELSSENLEGSEVSKNEFVVEEIEVEAIPGIGAAVPEELIEAVVTYMKKCASVQHGMVMPRNIRHYNCPPLENLGE